MGVKAILWTAIAVVVGLLIYNMGVKKLLKIDGYEY